LSKTAAADVCPARKTPGEKDNKQPELKSKPREVDSWMSLKE
jgi:hypothetical protein